MLHVLTPSFHTLVSSVLFLCALVSQRRVKLSFCVARWWLHVAPLPLHPRPQRRPQLLHTPLPVEMAGRAKLVPEPKTLAGTGSRRCVLLSPRCPPSRMPTLMPLRPDRKSVGLGKSVYVRVDRG